MTTATGSITTRARRTLVVPTVAFVVLTGIFLRHASRTTWGQVNVNELGAGALATLESMAPLPGPFFSLDVLLYSILGAGTLVAVGSAVWLGAKTCARLVGLVLRRRSGGLGEAGQAMTEVAVSFPTLLITTLILMQLALMYQAKNVVSYAAFSAARAAIVWIPSRAPLDADSPETEGLHTINIDGGEKIDKIHQAAAMACVPISPRASIVLDGLPLVGDLIAEAAASFTSLFNSFGLPGEYVDNALQRYAYSTFATEVRLYKATQGGFEELTGGLASWNYPDDPADVAVRVRHRYYLPIPVVNRFIGDTWSIVDGGPFFSLDLPGRYTFIRSVAVLPLEGKTGNPPITGFWDN